MGENELVFDAKEMKVIEVTCQCGTGIVFDCTNDKAAVPHVCPGCSNSDGKMQSWLLGYKQWHAAITGSDKQFHFRVRGAK